MDYWAFAACLLLLFIYGLTCADARTSVTVFYETHCPDSQKLLTEQVVPALDHFGSEINIELVPFGFADYRFVTGSLTFKCQHGQKECEGNTIHACAIKYYPQQRDDVVRFAACTMSHGADVLDFVDECAKKFNMEYDTLKKCAESKEGTKLLQEMGDRTGVGARIFSPTKRKFSYIPSTFIDGHPRVEESVADLQQAICKAASSKPKKCEDVDRRNAFSGVP